MEIVKEYEVHMNLTATEVYTGLIDSLFLLNKIKKMYEGRCLNSTLITKINKISQQSDVYCSKNDNIGSSELDIRFEADAVVFNDGNIIPNCEIKTIETTGQIICLAPNVVIRLEINRLIQSLGPESKIPVKVNNSSYQFGRREITVNGEAYFHPQNEYIIYQVKFDDNKTFSQESSEQFQILTDKIKEEIKSIPKSTNYSYFVDLFYPLNKVSEEKHKDLISILEYADYIKQDNFVFKHPTVNESTGKIYVMQDRPSEKFTKDYEVSFVIEKADTVIYQMLREYLNYLIMLRKYSELYDTKEKLDTNKKVWKLYKMKKK